MIAERDLAEAVGEQLGLPVAAADDYPQGPVTDVPLSPEFLRQSMAVPLADEDDAVVVAMSDPMDRYTIDALRGMILQVKDGGSNPIIGTIPPANPAYEDRNAAERNVWINGQNELLRAMASQEGVPVAEIHGDFLAQPSLEALFADHVHPNEEGYLVMTRSWFNAITNPGGASSARRSLGFWPFT